MAKKPSRKSVDWDRARRLYRIGQMTNSEIAEEVGCVKKTLQNRASREGWTRDLTTQVAEETRAALSRPQVEGETEAQAVASAGQEAARIIERHRSHIVTARGLIEGMFAELGEVGAAPKLIEEALINGLAGHDIDIGRILSAYSVGTRAKTMNQLAMSLTKLIESERKAWNLDEDRSEKPFELALREIAREEDDVDPMIEMQNADD